MPKLSRQVWHGLPAYGQALPPVIPSFRFESNPIFQNRHRPAYYKSGGVRSARAAMANDTDEV
jgi:hypothetical protein